MISVAVLDYDCGNVRSITNALLKAGASPILTRDAELIQSADAMIIPGVGAFGNAMNLLHKYDLIDQIYGFVKSGKALLGICLGMQMLFDQSEEFETSKGLGLIKGNVKKMPVEVNHSIRLPHIAWNSICPPVSDRWENSILNGIPTGSKMYFVHSYAGIPDSENDILSLTTYGNCCFVSSVQKENVFGCQFHPEKSREMGLHILERFIEIAEELINDRDNAAGTGKGRSVLRFAAAG